MPLLTLQTVLLYGDDRGSVMPVHLYEVDLPTNQHAAFLNEIGASYQVMLENIVGDEIGHTRSFWVEDAAEYLGETEQMLRRDRYPENEVPSALSTIPQVAVDTLLRDTLGSRRWSDTFGEEAVVYGRSLEDLIKIAKTPRPVTIETTKRIPLGTSVYYIQPDNLYASASGPFIFQGSQTGKEENYVPVDFVQRYGVVVEAFPLPTALGGKHNRWFARTKQGKKFESASRLRDQAIQKVKYKAAHAAFWQ